MLRSARLMGDTTGSAMFHSQARSGKVGLLSAMTRRDRKL
jgi:hypothetical protein